MNYLLVGKNGRPSMRAVFELMTTDCTLIINKGDSFHAYEKANPKRAEVLKRLPIIGKGDKIIRWGNTIKLEVDGGIAYNKSVGIAAGANKKKARILMQDAGIPVPKTWILFDDFVADGTKTGPYIVRPAKHKQGKQLVVANTVEEVEDAVVDFGDYYISEFYPKTREFRVHVAHGKVLIMHEKPAPEDKKTVAWNRHVNHDAFVVIKWGDFDIEIAQLAINAVKLLGLDMGAVDVLAFPAHAERKVRPRAVVCEVNTAPTLREYAQGKYAAYFDWLLVNKGRREHWDSTKWKEGKSFAWKNEQLGGKNE